jgi:outer membrane protein OmpA-like peptidoglycan-associated protein
MPTIKAMPLLLSVVTSFVIMSGVARAAEPQIILAQAQTPQQLEEEHKKKAQEQQHSQQQHQEQQKAQEQQRAQQQKQAQEQQQKALEQQKAQQQHQAQEKAQEQQKAQQQHQAQEKAQEQQKALQQKQAQEQQQKALEQQKAQQQHQAQEKAQEQQKAQELRRAQEQQHPGQQTPGKPNVPSTGQAHLPDHKDAVPGTPGHSDQAKVQPLQQHQPPKTGATSQQAAHPQLAPHRDLSAVDQKAKAERDAHRVEREKVIAKQQQQAVAEKTPAAVTERLKLQNEHFHAISSQRTQTVDRHGQTVITEPGNRTIIQTNNRVFIQHNETVNFSVYGGNVQSVRAPNGNTVSTIVRPGGLRLEVEVDGYGRPLRRVRILPDGRRFVLFENRPIEPGIGFALGSFIVDLAPPRIVIPREQYIVDADYASEDDIYGALQAGPVEPLDRGYSLDEILASVGLRERMRSISIDSINFEFGSWEVGPDQAAMLESVAAVMRDMTDQSPGEVFLIEGHTDAVGPVVDNLSLSDRRAQAVADVLSQQFGIPRENLVTQGYGKQFLLIPTDEPERRNRRVVVRRITPLLGGDSDRYSSGYGGPDNRDQR